MRFFRWTFLGTEIATFEFGEADVMEIEQPGEMTGGQMHNFERDETPANPDDRYRYEDRFGFR